MVRCPLDVAVSWAHHNSVRLDVATKHLGDTDNWFGRAATSSRARLPHRVGSWSEHVLSWTQAPGHRRIVIRYEDLKTDPLKQLQRIVEFLGEPWDEARARLAVQNTTFETLQREEQEKGFAERPHDVSCFFRKGKVGDWREALPPTLARQIALDHGEVMRMFGYAEEAAEAAACDRIPIVPGHLIERV